MKNTSWALCVLGLFVAAPAMWAGGLTEVPPTPCATGSLGSYIDGVNSGCILGVLLSTGWSYNVDEFNQPIMTAVATGGATELNSSQILVTPVVSSNGLGGSFSFSAEPGSSFGVGSMQSATYYIFWDYFIDPNPIMDEANLSLDPGNVAITQFFCNDLNMDSRGDSPMCQGNRGDFSFFTSPQSFGVTTDSPTNSITFAPPAFRFGVVETKIFLGGTGDAANFDNITSSLDVFDPSPEPASFGLLFAGLTTIAFRRKLARIRL